MSLKDPNVLDVPTGQIILENSPKVLQIRGLGSCIAIAFYTPQRQIGALAHVVLPTSENSNNFEFFGKYADTAIPRLLALFRKNNVLKRETVVKIVGGANMLSKFRNSALDVYRQNIQAVRQQLEKYQLNVAAEDLGGKKGRAVYFHLIDGRLEVYHVGGRLKAVL